MTKSKKFDVALGALELSVSCPKVLKTSRDFRIPEVFRFFVQRGARKNALCFLSHGCTETFLWTNPS